MKPETVTIRVPYHNHATATFEIRNAEAHIQKHWLGGAYYETSNRQGIGMLNWIYQSNYRGGVCIDVGACIGNHTVFFAHIVQMTVIAIEPHLPSYKHLIANIRHNEGLGDQITTIHAACGDHEGEIVTVVENKWNEGMVHVKERAPEYGASPGKVRLATLDSLIFPFDLKRVNFIKIDVEHYNAPVILGMQRTCERFEPDVYIECETPDEREGVDILMRDIGYQRRMGLIMNYTPTYLYEKKTHTL